MGLSYKFFMLGEVNYWDRVTYMKDFLKIFFLSLSCFLLAFLFGSYVSIQEKGINTKIGEKNIIDRKQDENDNKKNREAENENEENVQKENINSLEIGVKNSDRINIILLGMEDVRSDTIVFISIDPEQNNVDLISIPRDTYLHRKGYDRAEERKINCVYGQHGTDGVKKAVEYVLAGIPVDYYIMVDYAGVEKIVDSVGGVEVTVPFPMKYKDPTAEPPLNINISQGKQILDGKKAIQFLRYRKGNGGKSGYKNGDIGRIKAQQEFMKSFINKSLSYKLPFVIKACFDYVKTDIPLKEAVTIGKIVFKMKTEDFTFNTLAGTGDYKEVNGKTLSYFIQDEEATKEMLEKIYGVTKEAFSK